MRLLRGLNSRMLSLITTLSSEVESSARYFFMSPESGRVVAEELHVVTGAFGYTGRWIAHQLLDEGKRVGTTTTIWKSANTGHRAAYESTSIQPQ